MTLKAAILMYHEIIEGEPLNIYQRRNVDFLNDLKFLASNGYEIISLDSLLRPDLFNTAIQKKIIITFDDGNRSDFSLAFPSLKKCNMPATFFLVTNSINRQGYLKSENISEMLKVTDEKEYNLFSFQSHTHTHPHLSKSKREFKTTADYLKYLNDEIEISKNIIYELTKINPKWLSLPYGDGAYDPLIIKAAKANDFYGIRTSIWDVCSLSNTKLNLFSLPSLPVLSHTNIKEHLNRFGM